MDHTHLQMNPSMMTMPDSVILPFEDFAVDAEHNLGRANGNCYQRKPGIPNVHDGQIMVRLKKKRFIVIDYSVVPSPTDIACANVTPHLKCPPGAGSQKCTSSTCSKIGVPVCLFGKYCANICSKCDNNRNPCTFDHITIEFVFSDSSSTLLFLKIPSQTSPCLCTYVLGFASLAKGF